MEWPESLPWAAWFALHAGGLIVAVMSRLSLGMLADKAMQCLVTCGFLSIAAVAVLASMAGGDHLRLWVVSGTTLGLMVIAVVAEVADGHDPLLSRFASLDD